MEDTVRTLFSCSSGQFYARCLCAILPCSQCCLFSAGDETTNWGISASLTKQLRVSQYLFSILDDREVLWGEKILIGAVIKPVSYFPHIKCLMKLVVVWSLDSATVMLVVRVGAGFWSPGVSARFLSGINFEFPSAASGRLFMACSVYLLILCPWQSVPCPRPVGARGSAC